MDLKYFVLIIENNKYDISRESSERKIRFLVLTDQHCEVRL